MEKINLSFNGKINKGANMNKNFQYENLKSAYSETMSKLDNGDFKNSLSRYITELNFVEELKSEAFKINSCEYKKWEEKEKSIRDILKSEFSVEFER